MAKPGFEGGTAHALPPDLKRAIAASPQALATWQDITPLARPAAGRVAPHR